MTTKTGTNDVRRVVCVLVEVQGGLRWAMTTKIAFYKAQGAQMTENGHKRRQMRRLCPR